MTDATTLDRLNSLLIDLGRSLLQYADEAWPWTGANSSSDAKLSVVQLAARQRQSVACLVEYLDAQDHSIDFGVYPDEYTSLHYVSLDYLIDQLIVNQQALVEECEQTQSDIDADDEVRDLLNTITGEQQETLRTLQSLAQ